MKATQLLAAIKNVNGGSFVGLDTLVEVPLLGGKKNPQQGRVTKRMVGAQVMVFQNKEINAYDAMIKRRLEAEGKDPANFILSPRAWGERVPNMPIVTHNGKTYLEVIFLKAGAVEYRLDGAPIAESEIIGLKQGAAGEQGGLDNKVIIRTFAADSITEIRIDNKAFQ